MLAAQSGLVDFSARVVLHARVGAVPLPTLAVGLGQLLNGLGLTEKITFQAELSEHRVNAGLSDSFFAGAGARSASGRQSQQ